MLGTENAFGATSTGPSSRRDLLGFSDRRSFLLAFCLGLLFSQGCAMLQRAPVPTQPGTAKPTIKKSPSVQAKLPQTGKASWYGPQHQGKRTASGEIFDQALFTAAHQTLPFGTKIKVTNLANGKSVEVKINDRGPFIDNRIIDLSLAAAKALEMTQTGTAKVRLEPSSAP
jgi:rare lipoprotein A